MGEQQSKETDPEAGPKLPPQPTGHDEDSISSESDATYESSTSNESNQRAKDEGEEDAEESDSIGTLSGFHFFDCFRSIDVDNDGKVARCVHTCKATVFSKEVIDLPTTTPIEWKCIIVRRGMGTIACGVLGAQADDCGNRIIGEKELTNSVGLVQQSPDDKVRLMFREKAFGSYDVALKEGTVITLRLQDSRLSILVDQGQIQCDFLENASITGKYRVGLSLCSEGQVAAFGDAPPSAIASPVHEISSPLKAQQENFSRIAKRKLQDLRTRMMRVKRPFVQGRPHLFTRQAFMNQPTQLGSVAIVPCPGSPLRTFIEELCRTRRSFLPTPSPLSGFQLVDVEAVVLPPFRIQGYEVRQEVLRNIRETGGEAANAETRSMNAAQLQVLSALRDLFTDRPHGASISFPNALYTFHPSRVELHENIVRKGYGHLRPADPVHFGSGCYTTPHVEYAARSAAGEFDAPNTPPRPARSDGSFPVVMLCCCIGAAYPLTPSIDYSRRNDGLSDFFNKPLNKGFDCHCAAVCPPSLQAVDHCKMQYIEVVCDQEAQLLPLAILWFHRE